VTSLKQLRGWIDSVIATEEAASPEGDGKDQVGAQKHQPKRWPASISRFAEERLEVLRITIEKGIFVIAIRCNPRPELCGKMARENLIVSGNREVI
jgi:hypothetical protein